MRDIVPEGVLRIIRDRYSAGVSDAEYTFAQNQADEDSLTGALGQAISMRPLLFDTGSATFSIEISYAKLRGRGAGAPEKRLGADGLFQIRVTGRDGVITRQKALPFQSKKRWVGKNQKLVDQCRDMLRTLHGGIVLDFAPEGYTACQAGDAIEANGSKSQARKSGRVRDLGHLLAYEFLNCETGVIGMFYDPVEQTLEMPVRATGSRQIHAITTTIERVR